MIGFLVRCALVAGVCTAASPLAAQEPAPARDSVYELAEVDVAPALLNAAELEAAQEASYPPRLKDAGMNGSVLVAMTVGTDGRPRDLQLVSSGDTAFDAPTMAIASLLRFSPARVSGRNVRVRLELTIDWRLERPRDTPGPDSTGAYELSEVTEVPRPLNRDAIRAEMVRSYPRELRRSGVIGSVQVRMRLADNGRVSAAFVTHSTDARFNEASLALARVLRFTPATIGRKRVAVWVELPFQWEEPGAPRSDRPTRPAPRGP
ncbi:TonB family protein [Longimicrobium sp.]|jgi:TonB family protein|uniref:TonB family protein n=1 Tax=Longimicrobium sp. TaxID=2029185 RepID=UPI002ED80327